MDSFLIKILGKNSKGFKVIVQLKWKGYKKISVFRPISRFISKTVQDTAIVTMEDKYTLSQKKHVTTVHFDDKLN